MFKGISSKYLSSRFNTRASVHGRNTRNRDKLGIPAFNTAAGQRSFIYQAVKCWDSLPEEITKLETYVVSNLKLRVISLQFLHEFIIPFYIYYSSYVIVHTFMHRYLFTCKLLQEGPLGALINYYNYYYYCHSLC